MAHSIVVPEGNKAFYCELRKPVFMALRQMAFERHTTLKALADAAFTQYLIEQGVDLPEPEAGAA